MPKYKTYYGRKKLRWLRNAIILVLAGGFLALCVFILPDYVTYSEDGMSIDLPFFGRTARNPSPPPPAPSPSVLVEVSISPSPTPEPSPSPTPQKAEQVRALFIPMTMLAETEALETLHDQAQSAGVNMLALEYKDIQGSVVDEAVLAEAMTLLNRPGLTLTAVISACVDNTVPFGRNTNWAVKHRSGVNFKDHLDRRWLNLYLSEARAFIAEQVQNAYKDGFERVLLTYVGFPHSGGASQADYQGLDDIIGSVAAVNMLLSELREAAGERPLDAWLFPETVSEGLFEAAGQDLAVFTETFDLMFTLYPDDGLSRPFIPVIPPGGTEAEQGFMLYSEQGKYFD